MSGRGSSDVCIWTHTDPLMHTPHALYMHTHTVCVSKNVRLHPHTAHARTCTVLTRKWDILSRSPFLWLLPFPISYTWGRYRDTQLFEGGLILITLPGNQVNYSKLSCHHILWTYIYFYQLICCWGNIRLPRVIKVKWCQPLRHLRKSQRITTTIRIHGLGSINMCV